MTIKECGTENSYLMQSNLGYKWYETIIIQIVFPADYGRCLIFISSTVPYSNWKKSPSNLNPNGKTGYILKRV